ncbi:type II toxin-antitoxin system HicA family toxin [Paenibacillus pasadenensis]|uniref:type II toxin-antitoxin system HicA family toxin n=1 Tax=Paenibacillus pasadenensis TaxID=217090 RepID=UPI002040610B|nr:type II toxin-antitoxin system HicA family toxin [Paenibacillus pasadenensis]MCM3747474.1 type II toxin-antitoxin system HicA family toxin [Paenibacillus pasadenensis]
MAKIEKLIQKMRNKPKGITFEEVKKALEHAGYTEVRVNGSHHHFRNAQGLLTTVKRENPVNPKAVQDALRRYEG